MSSAVPHGFRTSAGSISGVASGGLSARHGPRSDPDVVEPLMVVATMSGQATVTSNVIPAHQSAPPDKPGGITRASIRRGSRGILMRGHSRLRMSHPKLVEPEIEEMPSGTGTGGLSDPESGGVGGGVVVDDGVISTSGGGGDCDEMTSSGQAGGCGGGPSGAAADGASRSSSSNKRKFMTRHKLERGTIAAFRREARHIIERDLPHISHRDNIIRVWADKGQAGLMAVATKTTGSVFTMKHFDRQFKYFFQHPYLRLFVSYFIIFCNFLVFAEDPVSHSKLEANIPVVGNVFSFVITKYPPDWRWRFLKVSMWLLAVGCGMIVGKTLIHGVIFSRFMRLKMFRADQGSWMVQFLTVIVSLYLFSHAYNVVLVLTFPASNKYTINSKMGLSNSSLMKAAACGTWLGDLISALIVTDMMLQDDLYPEWAPRVRRVWRETNIRIGVFWLGSILMTSMVIMVIATDWITWDRLNRDFVASTELSRAFLCSFVLVMDLTILMQDWDFPHFTNTLDVNLPGFYKHMVHFQALEIQISGKWFNYGLIFFVMIFDLNMWKNQIFYKPEYYGQYVAMDYRVYTVTNRTVLLTGNQSLWSYDERAKINPATNFPYMDDDLYMHSRFMNYPMSVKSMAFIPCIVGFITFLTLIALYGRVSEEANAGGATDVVDQRSQHSSPPTDGSCSSVGSDKKESISMTRLVKAENCTKKPSRQSSTDSAEPLAAD